MSVDRALANGDDVPSTPLPGLRTAVVVGAAIVAVFLRIDRPLHVTHLTPRRSDVGP